MHSLLSTLTIVLSLRLAWCQCPWVLEYGPLSDFPSQTVAWALQAKLPSSRGKIFEIVVIPFPQLQLVFTRATRMTVFSLCPYSLRLCSTWRTIFTFKVLCCIVEGYKQGPVPHLQWLFCCIRTTFLNILKYNFLLSFMWLSLVHGEKILQRA